jgi:hypothetical protein
VATLVVAQRRSPREELSDALGTFMTVVLVVSLACLLYGILRAFDVSNQASVKWATIIGLIAITGARLTATYAHRILVSDRPRALQSASIATGLPRRTAPVSRRTGAPMQPSREDPRPLHRWSPMPVRGVSTAESALRRENKVVSLYSSFRPAKADIRCGALVSTTLNEYATLNYMLEHCGEHFRPLVIKTLLVQEQGIRVMLLGMDGAIPEHIVRSLGRDEIKVVNLPGSAVARFEKAFRESGSFHRQTKNAVIAWAASA